MFAAINQACRGHGQVLVVGDFNYPSINWNTLECAAADEPFVDLIQDNFLTQHVHESTRGKNILDLVLSTEKNMVEDLQIIEHLSTGDHNMVEFNIVVAVELNNEKVTRRCYYKADYEKICSFLSNVEWVCII